MASYAAASKWPIGQSVIVTRDDGSEVVTETLSPPWKVGKVPIIKLDGFGAGGYSLARVRKNRKGGVQQQLFPFTKPQQATFIQEEVQHAASH